VIGKNSVRVQKRLFSLRLLTNSTIEGPNHVQTSPNFVGMITKFLWTRPQNESMNHSMIWEESKKFWARMRFSQEHKNFDSRRLVISGELALGQMDENHFKGSRDHQETTPHLVHKNWKRKSNFNQTRHENERNWDKIKTPEGTRREGPPFPTDPLTKSLESIVQILERGGGAERQGERESARDRGRAALFLRQGKGKRARERERLWGGI